MNFELCRIVSSIILLHVTVHTCVSCVHSKKLTFRSSVVISVFFWFWLAVANLRQIRTRPQPQMRRKKCPKSNELTARSIINWIGNPNPIIEPIIVASNGDKTITAWYVIDNWASPTVKFGDEFRSIRVTYPKVKYIQLTFRLKANLKKISRFQASVFETFFDFMVSLFFPSALNWPVNMIITVAIKAANP